MREKIPDFIELQRLASLIIVLSFIHCSFDQLIMSNHSLPA